MKQVATGRKNWLFIGSADAGERAANLLTLVSTAHRNDLDVWMYLNDALDQLLAGSTDYESLRADVWKQSHPEAVRTYRSDERRDTADRNRLTRAQRRLASAKKLAAAKLAAKKMTKPNSRNQNRKKLVPELGYTVRAARDRYGDGVRSRLCRHSAGRSSPLLKGRSLASQH